MKVVVRAQLERRGDEGEGEEVLVGLAVVGLPAVAAVIAAWPVLRLVELVELVLLPVLVALIPVRSPEAVVEDGEAVLRVTSCWVHGKTS